MLRKFEETRQTSNSSIVAIEPFEINKEVNVSDVMRKSFKNKSMKNLCKYGRSEQPRMKHTEQGSGFGIRKSRMFMTVIMLIWTKLMVIL